MYVPQCFPQTFIRVLDRIFWRQNDILTDRDRGIVWRQNDIVTDRERWIVWRQNDIMTDRDRAVLLPSLIIIGVLHTILLNLVSNQLNFNRKCNFNQESLVSFINNT